MNEQDFYDKIENRDNQKCNVSTTAGIYNDVIFIRVQPKTNPIMMIVKATGELYKMLNGISTTSGEKIKEGVFGIPVDLIKSIDF